MFNHNAYLRNVDDISLRNNLFMRSSSIHIKMTSSRKGASKNLHYQGNFFFDGEIGFSIGGNNHDPLWRFQDVVIEDNVLSNINLSRPTDRGFAWYIGLSDNKRTLVRNNILAHQTRYGNSYGVSLTDHGSMSDVNIEDNIFYNINRRPIRARGIDNNEYWSDINITRNTIQNYDTDSDTLINHYGVFDPVVEYSSNTYWSSGANWFAVDQNPSWPNKNYEEWVELSGETDSEARDVEFRDPDRDLARYHGHIAGEASYEEFIREAKKQDRYNWSYYYTAMAVNEYFREGFTPVSDIGPPGSVEDGKRELNAQTPEPVEDGKVLLSWRAPGGDGWKTNNIDGYYEVRYATYSVKNSSWSWWNSIENHERDYYSGIEYFKNPENVGYTENRIVEGLYSGATYYFGVRVYNNVEKASNLDYKLSGGEPVYAVAGDTIPYAPENLSVEYNTGEALLEWDRSPSVSVVDYRIYRSDISGVYDKVISTVSANPNSYSYVDDSGGEGYYYAASAIDHNGYESKIVCFDPDEIPPEIQDKTSRSRAYGTRKIRVRVTDDRNVVEVEGKYRPLGSNIKGYELDFFPEPGAGVIYSGVADVDKEKISKEGFEYYITAFDGTNTSEKGWIKIKPPSDIPQKSFITPDNPEFSFGRGVKEVLITDVRGNKVFEKSKGSENIITWDPSDGSTIRIESGIYIYRIKTESGYKYGTVVIAK